MTQEFHISVTPVGSQEYLVRTERVAPGVPLAEEQIVWAVDDWLMQARQLMGDPLLGLLQSESRSRVGSFEAPSPSDKAYGNQSPVQTMPPATSLVGLGQTLYNSLFQGTLRDSWMTAQGIAQHKGEMLRLRLGLKGTLLPRLPWEVMYASDRDGSAMRRPIATGTDVVFSRYQPGIGITAEHPLAAIQSEQPIRILMAIAAPTDQERLELRHEALNLQQELQRTAASTVEGNRAPSPDFEVTVLDQPGREQLTQALEQGHYHVLHYAGHSNLGVSGGNLYLVNQKTGLTEVLSGDDLAGLLVNNGIRMVVFNSCRGTHTAASDPGTSLDQPERNLAEALVSRGIPAVLAMAEKIPDDVALTLTRLFYRNLKQGYPIDLSLSRARQGLISAYGSHQLYWALPVLYLHPECDGYLLPSDRALVNPADRLLLLPQAYDAPPMLAGEELDYGALSPNVDLDDELEMISRAVLLEDDDEAFPALDLSTALKALEAGTDLSYEQDVEVVADLVKQLMPESAASPTDSPTESAIGMVRSPDLLDHPSSASPGVPDRNGDLGVTSNDGSTAQTSTEAPTSALPPTPTTKLALEPRAIASETGADSNANVTDSKSSTVSTPPIKRLYIGLPLLGAGIAAITALVLQTMPNSWLSSRPRPADLLPAASPSPSVPLLNPNTVNLETADSSTVTATATMQFNRNNLTEGEAAVAELLDRGALSAAKAALDNVPNDQLGSPGISFLRGRLAWQSAKQGNSDFSEDDAWRYWNTAVEKQPNSVLYLNALGFAYHSTGRPREASEAWCQSLALTRAMMSAASTATNGASTPETMECPVPTQPIAEPEALTAIAGYALALQAAADLPEYTQQRTTLLSRAANLYQLVMLSDAIAFQATELQNEWLWTPQMIEEWEQLSTQLLQ
ncbi:CHAT domain-containing protein [Leptolyngbya sp. AN02str]|uniref:CHAT domain-containing protein n=1 Tax=Leptolyngbya sp. AN02str TaxID=3423363 RepID=UPI003D312FF3